MPRLRVLAGSSTSPEALSDISHLVNTCTPYHVDSEVFAGAVVVRVKGFVGPGGGRGDQEADDEYFCSPERKGVTWSIQVRGRFLKPICADDVMFGNTFDRPLRLPWGSGAALAFMNLVDPNLEHALDSVTPWALSPLICTMPYFAHQRRQDGSEGGDDSWHIEPLQDSVSDLRSDTIDIPRFSTRKQRRTFFSGADKRKAVTFGPGDELTTDFCYGFLTFPKLTLSLPGGISFDLTKYWDGQPVRFVCCERSADGRGKLNGPGRTFWCVILEVVDDAEGEPIGTWSSRGGHNTPATNESGVD